MPTRRLVGDLLLVRRGGAIPRERRMSRCIRRHAQRMGRLRGRIHRGDDRIVRLRSRSDGYPALPLRRGRRFKSRGGISSVQHADRQRTASTEAGNEDDLQRQDLRRMQGPYLRLCQRRRTERRLVVRRQSQRPLEGEVPTRLRHSALDAGGRGTYRHVQPQDALRR